MFRGANMKKKDVYFVGAILHQDKNILIMRESNQPSLPTHPFFFPGAMMVKHVDPDLLLVEEVKAKYGLDIAIEEYVGESVVETLNQIIHLHAYYARFINKPQFNRKQIDYRFVSVDDLLSYFLDANDHLIAERIYYFNDVYNLSLPTKTKDYHSNKELWFYYDSLLYYKKRMVKKDYEDIVNLIYTDVDIKKFRQAYKWILKQNNLDYNEYLNHVDYLTYLKKK